MQTDTDVTDTLDADTGPAANTAAFPEIAAASRAVAEAEEALAEAAARLQAAQSEVQTAAGRLADLRAQHAATVARRAAGDCRPGDGAELALIAADQEGLSQIAAAVAARVAEARAPHEAARRQHQEARAGLDRLCAERDRDALLAHAQVLDARRTETVLELDRAAAALGALRSPWRPAQEFAEGVRRVEYNNFFSPRWPT